MNYYTLRIENRIKRFENTHYISYISYKKAFFRVRLSIK